MKGVLFVNSIYTKGIPFSWKMVYKRVRGWTSGLEPSRQTFVEYPPGGGGWAVVFDLKTTRLRVLYVAQVLSQWIVFLAN